MNDTDKSLRQAYQQAKRQHPAPGRLRRQLLRSTKASKSPFFSGFWSRDTALMASAALTLVVLLGIYQFRHQVLTEPRALSVSVGIEIHAYDDEIDAMPNSQNREKLTAYNQAYERKMETIQAVNTRFAKVLEVSGEWSLADCSDIRILISDRLIENLRDHSRIESGIDVGDQVALILNREGQIMQITHSNQKALQC
ncbi:hypothetical protein DXV75_15485 [Alteromonas aestuariivivens]|uniref:Uncharacterized protein n=1 Tax=Alteromonas aestuariivivens TaxID=1938339 RepID=A0A3D8M323_9ALTE|nr:hypothetical protein [Alteromonas aestuariivivens]RDV24089.1 hypothetical protein DXV75_15485 [Alteromonas aestuariivivens]